ncbi:MAG: acyl-CoA dehydrogenase family protein [Myxococcota bacterium]
MDFSYTEEQQSIIDLASQILRDGTAQERLREIEKADGPRFDRQLWSQLGEAGLLGVAIPEEQGGADLGFLEVAGIIEQVGRTAAPVPVLETVVQGALPLTEFGSDAQKETWLPKIASGEAIFTAALTEPEGDPRRPLTRATPDGDGWKLSGTKFCVPFAEIADAMLVPAATGGAGAVGVFLVDPKTAGVSITPLETTAGQPEARVDLEDVRVEAGAVLGDAEKGLPIVDWLVEHTNAALANLGLGACTEALELTKEYAKTRKQFDQPIAMFQAVGHRAADAYIDLEGVRLTTLQASWRLSAGLPAAKEVLLAKHWVSEAGNRVVHAATHLHGGVGVDREYPLHRFFLMVRQLQLTLGASTPSLVALGKLLAEEDD